MVGGNISGMFETTARVCELFLWSIWLSKQLSLLFLSACWHISLCWGDTYIESSLAYTNPPRALAESWKCRASEKATSGLRWTHSWETQLSARRSPKVDFQPEKLKCGVWVFSWAGSNECSLWWTPAGLRQRALSPFWAHLHTKWSQRKHVSH